MTPTVNFYGDAGDSPIDEPVVMPDEEDDDFVPGPLDEEEHQKQRERAEKGNRGVDEIPGFGEGA